MFNLDIKVIDCLELNESFYLFLFLLGLPAGRNHTFIIRSQDQRPSLHFSSQARSLDHQATHTRTLNFLSRPQTPKGSHPTTPSPITRSTAFIAFQQSGQITRSPGHAHSNTQFSWQAPNPKGEPQDNSITDHTITDH